MGENDGLGTLTKHMVPSDRTPLKTAPALLSPNRDNQERCLNSIHQARFLAEAQEDAVIGIRTKYLILPGL